MNIRNSKKDSQAEYTRIANARREIRKAQVHEDAKRGGPGYGPNYIKDDTLHQTYIREMDAKKRARDIESARSHEENKARGTSSSAVRVLLK